MASRLVQSRRMADQLDADAEPTSAKVDLLESPGTIKELVLEVIRALGYRHFGEPAPYFGKYAVEAVIGSGGYGAVFEGWDAGLERKVAIKLCDCDPDMNTALILAEARTLALLSHPNIVAVHDFGAHEGRMFLVMEHVSGGTLHDYAIEDEPSSWQELIKLFADVARGLAYAHDKGVIHGDLKPANILLDGEGLRPRIADFGLARVLDRDALLPSAIGTLLYAAPELLAGEMRDQLSDQWAFFVSLCHCIDGKLPIVDTDAQDVPSTEAQMREAILRWRGPSALHMPLSDELAEVLRVGLSLDPSERFADMHAVAHALDEVLASGLVAGPTLVVGPSSEGVVVSPMATPSTSARPPWWKKGGLMALLVAMGSGLVAQGYLLAQLRGDEPRATEEQAALQQSTPLQPEPSTQPENEPYSSPCVVGDIPVAPDPSVESMCQILRAGNYEAVDPLWVELSNGRERSARKSSDSRGWLALACSAAVLAQTSQQSAGLGSSKRARGLHKRAQQFANDAEFFLGEMAGDATEANSAVISVIMKVRANAPPSQEQLEDG